MGLRSWLLEVFRMTVDVTSMDSSTLSSHTMLMKLGYSVYWDTTIALRENAPHASPTHNATWRKLGFFHDFEHLMLISPLFLSRCGWNLATMCMGMHHYATRRNDPLAPLLTTPPSGNLDFSSLWALIACFSTDLDETFLQCVRRPSIQYMENEGLALRAHCLTGMSHE